MHQRIVLPVNFFASPHPPVQTRFLEFRRSRKLIPVPVLYFYFLIFPSRFTFAIMFLISKSDHRFTPQFEIDLSISAITLTPLNILHVVWSQSPYRYVVSLEFNSFVLSFSYAHSDSSCKFYSEHGDTYFSFASLCPSVQSQIFDTGDDSLGIKLSVLFFLWLIIFLDLFLRETTTR